MIRLAYNILNLFTFLKIRNGWMKRLRKAYNKKYIIHEGKRFNLGENDSLFLIKNEFEKKERKWFKKNLKPNWVVVDIGANMGYHTVLFSKLCEYVYAFEPCKETYTLLFRNAEHCKNVLLYNIALADKTGISKLCINPSTNGDNSLKSSFERTDYEIVNLRQLDFLIDTKVDFIKIDIEGGELEAIKGGLELIKKYKPILMVEFNKNCSNVNTLKFEIENLGYKIYSIKRNGDLKKFKNKKLQNIIAK